jgi:tRNA(adenine34) deaminase
MLSKTDKMKLTLQLAAEAMDKGEFPIAAAVFLDDEMIACSFTKEVSEKRLLIHAELNALIEADMKRYRYPDRKRMQLFTNLEPCMMCMGAAMSLNIGEIYYALESPSDGAVKLAQDWNPQSDDFSIYKVPMVYGGILREESKELFRQYADRCKYEGMKIFAQGLAEL